MIQLKQSPVIYNEEFHTYLLGDVILKGITGMIHRQIFPDKYKDIPKSILNRAAERGHRIHADVEMSDATGIENSIEANNYVELRRNAGYIAIANEYIVSDEKDFASPIDIVWEHDGKIALVDIKTTYGGLDKDYLSWQLSVYAYLFEMQNGIKVDRLYGLWLRDNKCLLEDISRKNDEDIKELMRCEVEGLQFKSSEVKQINDTQLISRQAIDMLVNLHRQEEEIKKKSEEVKELLRLAMNENDVISWDAEQFKATITKETVRKSFDSSRFQSENPELYSKYLKESKVKESIKITYR